MNTNTIAHANIKYILVMDASEYFCLTLEILLKKHEIQVYAIGKTPFSTLLDLITTSAPNAFLCEKKLFDEYPQVEQVQLWALLTNMPVPLVFLTDGETTEAVAEIHSSILKGHFTKPLQAVSFYEQLMACVQQPPSNKNC